MKHVLLLCLLALVCGCSSDKVPSHETDDVPVNFRIVTRSGSAYTEASEMKLESIRILVYDKDNQLEESQLLDETLLTASETAPGSGVYFVKCVMKILSGNKTFCLVANEGETLLADALDDANVQTLSALEGVILEAIPGKGNVLPFTCRKACSVKPEKNEIDFLLSRAVARVDLRLWKAADETAEVKLTSIEVLNKAIKSSLMEGNPLSKTEASCGNYAMPTYSPVKDIVTKPTTEEAQNAKEQVLDSFYLFEYTAAAGDDPTSLKVNFTVDGADKSVTIPLAGAKDEDGNYIYCIKRNTLTDLRLTYENGGLKLNYTVLDWNDTTNPYDKELGEDDSNWWYADWIDVDYYETEIQGNSF